MMTPIIHRGASAACAALVASLTIATTVAAQSAATTDAGSDAIRALGMSVAASGGPRDTLGLLIASVTRDGPADQAGITPGSRVIAVNGLLVRLAPANIGSRAAADSALVRFERAVRISGAPNDVVLRVPGATRTRVVSLPVTKGTSTTSSRIAPAPAPVSVPERDTAAPPPLPFPSSTAPSGAASPTPATVPAPAPVQPPASSPTPRPVAAPVSAATATQTTSAPKVGSSLQGIVETLASVQQELRRVARETRDIALSDSLAELDDELASLRRRLRLLSPTEQAATPVAVAPVAVPAPSPVPTPASPPAEPTRTTVNGLELAKVSGDLATFLGPQGASALVVVNVSDAWDPLRAGDVVLQVDGAAPDLARLHAAVDAHATVALTVQRRGRTFTVSFGGTTR